MAFAIFGHLLCLGEIMNTNTAFLTKDEISFLTGRKFKSKQIETLRHMRVAFFVNGAGHPIVARCSIEGKALSITQQKTWTPKILAQNT